MEINNVAELLNRLQENKIVIYGAGYVATRFYQSLKEHNLETNVECFITTCGQNDKIDGISVKKADELVNKPGMMICVAVHETIRDEIILLLEKKRIKNYIWIYPFQFDLMLGEPTKRAVDVPMRRLTKANHKYYWLAVRYLVIDQYYNKNNEGYNLYVKMVSLHCNRQTAEMRLQQFIHLIEAWEKDGYDDTYPIKILENDEIFDGTHRFSLASYFNQDYIKCEIYKKAKSVLDIHNGSVMMEKQSILQAGLSLDEIKLLEDTNHRIKMRYNLE